MIVVVLCTLGFHTYLRGYHTYLGPCNNTTCNGVSLLGYIYSLSLIVLTSVYTWGIPQNMLIDSVDIGESKNGRHY